MSGEQPRPPPPGAEITADEEKRRSTGSISSLVRIWETDSSGGGAGNLGAATSPSGAGGQLSEEGSRPGSVVKFEKRVWPPVKDRERENFFEPTSIQLFLLPVVFNTGPNFYHRFLSTKLIKIPYTLATHTSIFWQEFNAPTFAYVYLEFFYLNPIAAVAG